MARRVGWIQSQCDRPPHCSTTRYRQNDRDAAAGLRLASQIVFEHGDSRGLLAFRFADTHLHVLLMCLRAAAGIFARSVEGALRKRLGIPIAFEGARIRPIETVRHLSNGFRYTFRQEAHHGTAFDPAHEGSNLPELLGMRVRPSGIGARVRAAVPRLTRATLLEWLGTSVIDDSEASTDITLVSEASAAAFGIANLYGLSRAHASARRAAVHVLDKLAPEHDPATLLSLPVRSVNRYRVEQAPATDLRAVERQLRLRTFLRERFDVGGL